MPGSRGRHRKRGARWLVQVAEWTVASVVVLGIAGLGYLFLKFNDNLQTVDIDQALGDDRPQNVDNGSMDILVLGSDSRNGANSEYGHDDGSARSDTAMIVHLYEGRQKAEAISIPRDTMVARPACTTRDGGTDPGSRRAMFNESFSVGGAACAVKTVEALSGLRMDHYIEVDFTGFKKIVDGLGGVEVTTNKPIKDGSSHLDLPVGTSRLDGEQALGLVRTRKSVGDGSDLGRIQLQQAFVKALVKQVNGIGIFDSPKRLLSLADTATKAITTDTALGDVTSLLGFARDFQGLDAGNLHMITLPVTADPLDPNRVVPLADAASAVWDALRGDQPVPAWVTERSTGDKGSAKTVVR
ncbi:LCP family protein [Streptomyces sp. NPDC048270]|uniref:LCP family protein n=1 Tax=Streptomyces sp. NPDC048270 TaxID=3154615 RepID=UPI003404A9A5